MKGAAWTHASTPLQLGNAVAAIIVVDGGGYLLQLRDPLPQIWYPDHWGLFGGAIDPGEDDVTALRRELREELSLNFEDAQHVFRLDFRLPNHSSQKFFRSYYEIKLTSADLKSCVLGEGAQMRIFAPNEIFGGLRVAPYDAFPLFLHDASSRLR